MGAPGSQQYFGISVAISGDTAVVGMPYENDYSGTGKAYVYVRTGSSWAYQATLSAATGASGDWFGSGVAISGDTAVVGARNHGTSGAAFVFTRTGTSWGQQATLTGSDAVEGAQQGLSVALDGETAVVGGAGSAYVFTRSGTSWSEQSMPAAPAGAAGFGSSVSIDGETAVVGARSETVGPNAGQGAAYVFTQSGSSWAQQARLLASDGAVNDNFGWSVALSGDTALVGPQFHSAGLTNQGAAYVFVRSGASWSQQAVLTDSDASSYAQLGYSVAVDGDTAVAGAPWDGGWGTPSAALGAACVYTRSGTTWTQQDKLTAFDGAGGDWFGFSVACARGTVLVGAPHDDVGSPVSLIDQGSASAFMLDDPVPPTTLLNVTGGTLGQNGWYVSAPSITLTADEPGTTWYKWDSGVDTEYVSGFPPLAGSHTLTYWSVDASDNIEDPKPTHAFKLDSTPPGTPGNVGVAQISADSARVTWSAATDSQSGILSYAVYLVDGSTYTTVTAGIASGSTSHEITGLGVGSYSVALRAFNSAGTASSYTSPVSFQISNDPVLVVTPIEGADRFTTAIAVSEKAFSSATNVVIATGYNWPDALGGAALAGALDGPILLTAPTALPGSVIDEIERLGATHAYVLGSESAVSKGVYNALDAIPGVAVERIGGKSRYETANMIAERTIGLMDAGPGYDGTAFVATGMNFPDALGASPLAAAKGWPIYLVNPASGDNAGLVSIMDAAGVKSAIVLGGTNVVSSSVADRLQAVLGGGAPERLFGGNRYATARAVASYGVSDAGLTWNKLALATGQNFPDALAGGVLQGRDGSVMMLTPGLTLDSGVATVLSANKASIFEVRFLGSTKALSQDVRTAVSNALD